MTRIVIDCRFAHLHAGLGRYTRAMTTGLLRQGEVDYVLLVNEVGALWCRSLAAEHIVTDIPHYSLREQTSLPAVLAGAKADLLYTPHFNVPWQSPIPFVFTLHDLILHRYPNSAPLHKRLGYRLLMRRAVSSATRIVAVTPFVASELLAVYGSHAADKTAVIGEGVEDHFRPTPRSVCAGALAALRVPERYFVYVGNAKQHKNVSLLLSVFASLPQEHLVIVGDGPEYAGLTLPDNVLRLPTVADEVLPALYSSAVACVTASLYEGFCLPLVEALACGCPVIAPRQSAIPDVVQESESVRLVEPTTEAFCEAICAPPSSRLPQRPWQWDESALQLSRLLRQACER